MGDFWEHLDLVGSMELLQAYLDSVESFLETKQKKLAEESKRLESRRQDLRENIKAGKKVEADWEQLHCDDQNFEYEEFIWGQLSRRLRNSLFVTLYTFFEKQLRQMCLSKQPDDIKLSVDEIAGRSITEKVETYWEKVLGLQFPRNSYWGDIHQGYRRLRNCIVHNDGILDDNLFADDRRYLEKFIQSKAYKGLLSLSGDVIVLHKDFCYKALGTIESFFHTLIDSC